MLKKLSLLLCILLTSCSVFKSNIPQPEKEFRGVWVATVVNIDWPQNGTDALEKQKADYIALLEDYEALNFNAIIVQIRTAGDAFYPSKLAPWSRFLTGKEGEASDGHVGLLEWMIEETHQRGFEFHAWLNPYRATFDENTTILNEQHDFHQHPEWMVKYGKKYYYNPGIPEVQNHLVAIIDEVVANYDIDAIHFDDYFYPYRIQGERFADSLTYENYRLPQQSQADWRRSNIDSLVKKTHQSIKEKKPWVQLGISPFGVWKNKSTDPKGSDTRAGQTTYEDLYADPLTWMKNGWIDYLIPQVYWSMDLPVASHRKIVDWWASQKSPHTNLYIGNGAYKIRNNSDLAWENKKEIPNQLLLARKTKEITGNVYFSAKSLRGQHRDITKQLKRKYYKNKVLPPNVPRALAHSKSGVSILSVKEKKETYQLKYNAVGYIPIRYVQLYGTKKENSVRITKLKKQLGKLFLSDKNTFEISKNILHNKKHLSLIFIDAFGRESAPIVLNLNQKGLYDTKR